MLIEHVPIMRLSKTAVLTFADVVTRVKRTALSRSCPCPVFVRIFRKVLSGVCPVSGFCQNSLSGVCLSGLCLSRFCPMSGFCLDFQEKSVRCLSVRPDKDKTEVSGFLLSLST